MADSARGHPTVGLAVPLPAPLAHEGRVPRLDVAGGKLLQRGVSEERKDLPGDQLTISLGGPRGDRTARLPVRQPLQDKRADGEP